MPTSIPEPLPFHTLPIHPLLPPPSAKSKGIAPLMRGLTCIIRLSSRTRVRIIAPTIYLARVRRHETSLYAAAEVV